MPVLVGLGLERGDGSSIEFNGFSISSFVRLQLPPPKRQTIRAHGKRRHARTGEELQHYTAMRTKSCKLIGRTKCTAVENIIIWPNNMTILLAGKIQTARQIQSFVRHDGFVSVEDMQSFWKENHPGVDKFEGVVIRWEPLT